MNELEENQQTVKKSGFGRGLIFGVIAGLSIAILAGVVLLNVFYHKGFVHIGVNGEIYVQDTATTEDEGIGSEVEAKLNAMDSLMDLFYMEDVDTDTAKEMIYKAYLASYGDKYTVYYTPDECKNLLESTTGKFEGIGAVCRKNDDGTVEIMDAYEDAPAYAAGLRNGDIITTVDGTDITGLDLTSTVALIKGDKGTSVHLDAIRDETAFSVDVVRDEIHTQTVKYEMRENQIGYLSISEFDDVTTQQYKDALQALEDAGMQGLVIDLRNNPGGVLDTVVKMLDYTLPDGLIVYTENKSGKRTEYKGTDGHELDIPIAVLVNGNSASASEIFAGAMQDYDKGEIIGTQTFGKGIVQSILPFNDGSAIKITVSRYFTPRGTCIHKEGITPDVEVELNEELKTKLTIEKSEDNQLQKAIENVKEQIAAE